MRGPPKRVRRTRVAAQRGRGGEGGCAVQERPHSEDGSQVWLAPVFWQDKKPSRLFLALTTFTSSVVQHDARAARSIGSAVISLLSYGLVRRHAMAAERLNEWI